MGRIVITHSTYIKGLLKFLKILVKLEGIKTITPGIIRNTKSRVESLEVRITTPITGGYKLLARKGKTVQEIFIITEEKEEVLKDYITWSFKKLVKPKNVNS